MNYFKTYFIITIIFGGITTLAMPPWGYVMLLWITFPAIIICINKTKNKIEAFFLGWAFGFGHFITSLAWIGEAFIVEVDKFGIFMVPAILCLAIGFAIYVGLVTLLQHILNHEIKQLIPNHKNFFLICSIIMFGCSWTAVEWLRGVLFTGFPWNPIGSVWVDVPEILSATSYVGVYGATLVTIISCGSISILNIREQWRPQISVLGLCHIPLILMFASGSLQLVNNTITMVPEVVLRLIQPNIAQADKWKLELKDQHILKQIQMSQDSSDHVTHFIWPEAAIPYALNQSNQVRQMIMSAIPKNKTLLSGAPRLERVLEKNKIFNSFFALNNDGDILAYYDKTHLVPFGEYNPLGRILPISGLTGSSFTPGERLKTIQLASLPSFTPLICYEIIFSGYVTEKADRPKWLLNITNDGWFGLSSGPHQHLAAARFRAAEEGLPVIRVANTGISAVIGPRGRILKKIDIGTEGFLDTALPNPLTPTWFSKYKNIPLLLLLAIVFSITAINIILHKTKKKFN